VSSHRASRIDPAAFGVGTGQFCPDTRAFREVDEGLAAALAQPEAPAWIEALARLSARVLETGNAATRAVPEAEPDGRTWVVWVASHDEAWVDVVVAPLPGEAAADVAASHIRALRGPPLESIGRFASAVAHDFNNLLAAVRVCAHALRQSVPTDAERRDCERILEATERAARLTRGLLDFAGRGGGPRARFDLREVVAGLSDLLQSMLGGAVHTRVEVPDSPCFVEADPGQVKQVILNLVLNAKEAVGDEGRVTVFLAPCVVGAAGEASRWRLSPGRYHVLGVEDDGPGIPPAIRPRVFEPYFSTKTKDGQRGLGLGLSTVYGIARRLGGDVRIVDGEAGGARVEVALPAVGAGMSPSAGQAGSAPRGRRGDTVVVVDDDALVRSTTAAFVESLGYRVFETDSGLGALSIVSEHKDRVEAVLLDMIMPGMNGLATCRALRRVAPDVRVLLMSGCTVPVDTEAALAEGAECFVPKPFDLERLARLLGRVEDPAGTR